jgi:hypothetical protein
VEGDEALEAITMLNNLIEIETNSQRREEIVRQI